MIAIAGGLFARRALFLTRLVRSGKPVNRVSDIPIRVRNETTIVLGQRKLLQRLGPGLVHAFIFWGFVVLFPTIFMAIVAIVDREPSLPSGSPLGWLESQGWYALLVDLFAVLVLAASRRRSGSARCSGLGASRAATSERPTSSSR